MLFEKKNYIFIATKLNNSMAVLTFDKNELGNLEYSLTREMLSTDRRGGYMSTTIVCCNTRKYHGLIVTPIDDSNRDFVLLSSLDETIILDGQRFNLALHRYTGVYEPRGHKYITDFEYTPVPTITYRIGSVVLRKELLWVHRRTQLMVRYTLVEGDVKSLKIQLRPFLAFRDRHELSKANMYADGSSYPIDGGVKCRLYDNFPWLNMQCSRKAEFIPAPDWYYDFEYLKEIDRGYEGHEDLLTPGYFELKLKIGESVIFSGSTEDNIVAKNIASDFKESLGRRTNKIDGHTCLRHSARQFIIRLGSDGHLGMIAGYPWYGFVGREALVALPGLTLEQGNVEDCMAVMDTIFEAKSIEERHYTLNPSYAADALLWAFRVWQELETYIGADKVWERYGESMKSILECYRSGCAGNVVMHDNGLIWAWNNDRSLTWMNTTAELRRFTSRRNGYHVEVNALWYNAVSYALDLAIKAKDSSFVDSWSSLPERIKGSFLTLFSLEDGCLVDYLNNETRERSITPSMIIASSLRYKMISEQQQVAIIRAVRQNLLTPMGLRSLAPDNPLYGLGQVTTDNFGAKNGSVWPWMLMFYVRACFDILGDSFTSEAESLVSSLEENIVSAGIGSISEYFYADPPYKPRGAISQAWSVASVLEIMQMVEQHKGKKSATPKKATPKKSPAKKVATKATAKKSAPAKKS